MDFANFLNFEPVLSPALRPSDGELLVATRDIELALTSRNAEEVRLSEDDTFAGVFFETLAPTLPFQLSDVGGLKTVYGQFKSPTGATSAPIPVVIEYVDQGPMNDGFSIAEGQVITRPLNVDVSFTSIFDIDRIDLLLDGVVLTSSTVDAFTYYWDPRNEADGCAHDIAVRDRHSRQYRAGGPLDLDCAACRHRRR